MLPGIVLVTGDKHAIEGIPHNPSFTYTHCNHSHHLPGAGNRRCGSRELRLFGRSSTQIRNVAFA